MNITEERNWAFRGEIVECAADYFWFMAPHVIDPGQYWLEIYNQGFLLAARVNIAIEGVGYRVTPILEDYVDQHAFTDVINYARRRIQMRFGLESLDGDIYEPYEGSAE